MIFYSTYLWTDSILKGLSGENYVGQTTQIVIGQCLGNQSFLGDTLDTAYREIWRVPVPPVCWPGIKGSVQPNLSGIFLHILWKLYKGLSSQGIKFKFY